MHCSSAGSCLLLKSSRCTVHQQMYFCQISAVAIFVSKVLFIAAGISLATGTVHRIWISIPCGCLLCQRHRFIPIPCDWSHVLLAEPLGSLAFKMVQVRQLENEQKVKLKVSCWVPVGSTYNTCGYIVVIDSILDTETIPTGIFDSIQHGQSAEGFVDFFIHKILDSSNYSNPSSFSSSLTSSSYSSSDSRMHFTDDIPQIHMPTVAYPSTDFIEATAQLRASIDQIHLEQVQTKERVEEFKSKLSQKIIKLELAFAQATSWQDLVYRAQINDIQEGLNTLRAQLSEIIAYINRGRDDKRGEESSRGPQPEDRRRPSGGGSGGSRSEPSKRGSGSHRGRGSRSSGFSR
ncbi:hypothetical protein F511_23823 [Dorcoceras hygrometricum]|uniref:Uncharacterized protein n=1 Tax=Dorcoceras hygrometricum TaxID=472368 RepID=A0A2Z7C0T0_9LAMI|nr:hypothetical protein F511_23823 [Dorcoceras hygrometricum]